MTKINNTVIYVYDTNISDNDFVIGSDADTTKKQTKNYRVLDFRDYLLAGLSPETGGTQKISEIIYNGELYTTPSAVANALNPAVQIQRYEDCIVTIKGDRYRLKLQNTTIGVLQTPINDSDFIVLSKNTSIGDGISTIKYNQNTQAHEHYSNKSSTIQIAKELDEEGNETGNIIFEIPSSSSIPGLYVNDNYIPTYDEWFSGKDEMDNYKGDGTTARPFTNTIKYTSETESNIIPNTSIQNAIDAYVGTGTRLAPQRSGQQIIVQNNNGTYIFPGDLSVNNINLINQGKIISTTSGLLVDMNNPTFFGATTSSARITNEQGASIDVRGEGLTNHGNTISDTTFATGRTLYLLGEGEIFSEVNDITKYLLNSDGDSNANGTTGCNNDGNQCIEVRCKVRSNYGGVYKVGGKSKIQFYNALDSSNLGISVNPNLQAFRQTGGTLRLSDGCVVGSFGTSRTNVFTFEPLNGFLPLFETRAITLRGFGINWFSKLNNLTVSFDSVNTNTQFFSGNNLFNSPDLWRVNYRNNTLESVSVDFTKVDFTNNNTVSAINTIGNYVIESLMVFPSKFNANASGAPKGTAFINRKTITAGAFVIGLEYKIATIGTTNFTLIGASANTVGTYFTATGAGTGTGTAYLDTRDTLN